MNGFKYRDEEFARRIISDEFSELLKVDYNEKDFNKLVAIHKFYIGKEFNLSPLLNDEKEQTELEQFYKNKTKEEMLNELKSLENTDS